jgi:hypothetical protein
MMLLESIDLSYKCELRVMFALIMCVNECVLINVRYLLALVYQGIFSIRSL